MIFKGKNMNLTVRVIRFLNKNYYKIIFFLLILIFSKF